MKIKRPLLEHVRPVHFHGIKVIPSPYQTAAIDIRHAVREDFHNDSLRYYPKQRHIIMSFNPSRDINMSPLPYMPMKQDVSIKDASDNSMY